MSSDLVEFIQKWERIGDLRHWAAEYHRLSQKERENCKHVIIDLSFTSISGSMQKVLELVYLLISIWT